MVDLNDPCSDGLSPSCFRTYPVWARKAFAYRLFCMLSPSQITRRLQRYLVDAIFAPGVEFPPGYFPPPGAVYPPGSVLGPVIAPGDPIPPGYVPPVAPIGEIPNPINPPISPVPPWTPGPPRAPALDPLPGGPVELAIVSGSADGFINNRGATWANVKAILDTAEVNDTDTDSEFSMSAYFDFLLYFIWRAYLYFDLSGVPIGRTITSAVLTALGLGDAGHVVSIQEGTQHDTLEEDDFFEFTGTFFNQQTWVIGSGPGWTLNNIIFNAGGLTYLNTVIGSTAKLCVRDYTRDYLDSEPPFGGYKAGIAFSEYATEARRPILTVIYE